VELNGGSDCINNIMQEFLVSVAYFRCTVSSNHVPLCPVLELCTLLNGPVNEIIKKNTKNSQYILFKIQAKENKE
jgi:hypothetical protein